MALAGKGKPAAITKFCFMIFFKPNHTWSAHWIHTGDLRLWTFGSWIVIRLYPKDDSLRATGIYWFCNAATGQSWQQKMGDHHMWFLYMDNRYALFRDKNNIYRYTVGNNKLVHKTLLISDPRIRCVYWACAIPKPPPAETSQAPHFFWEKPGFKLPKAFQVPKYSKPHPAGKP